MTLAHAVDMEYCWLSHWTWATWWCYSPEVSGKQTCAQCLSAHFLPHNVQSPFVHGILEYFSTQLSLFNLLFLNMLEIIF